jgi:hypothetical protein
MSGITHRGASGKPDFLTLGRDVVIEEWVPDAIAVASEVKSTRNLPIPITADSVSDLYNQAYQDTVVNREVKSNAWSPMCHHIGQLLGYMVENGHRHGALTSRTRKYFIRIDGSGSTATVQISDPWFVG